MKRYIDGIILLVVLFASAGLTIGLTYAPCYATVCVEDFFGLETRVHIAVYYSILATIGATLSIRATSGRASRISNTYLTRTKVPIIQKQITLGGLALTLWITAIIALTTTYWINAEHHFWGLRTIPLHWSTVRMELTAVGTLGHFADILLGLVVLPVSRNTLIGRVFELHRGSLITMHKLVAYALILLVFAHGVSYFIFIGTYNAIKDSSHAKKDAFEVDNAFYTAEEIERRGEWWTASLPTGLVTLLLMIIVIITALPNLRRKAYNVFYYSHILATPGIFIAASLHASTNFYFLLPGLLLWIADWVWRLFRGYSGLANTVCGSLTSAGGGWYRITFAAPTSTTHRHELAYAVDKVVENESASPLESYEINIPCISKLQNHAFTAAVPASHKAGPVVLFKPVSQESKKSQKKADKEWTRKLARLIDDGGDVEGGMALNCRVEGPYTTNGSSFASADQMVCVVGGTGLTGAYSLALWWLKYRVEKSNDHFTLLWIIREREDAELTEWLDLTKSVEAIPNMTLLVHVTSEDGRLDVKQWLRCRLSMEGLDGDENRGAQESGSESTGGGTGWVYGSGPQGLLDDVEEECVSLERALRKRVTDEKSGLTIRRLTHHMEKRE